MSEPYDSYDRYASSLWTRCGMRSMAWCAARIFVQMCRQSNNRGFALLKIGVCGCMRLLVALLCCSVGGLWFVGLAFGGEASSPIGGPLVVPEVQPLDGDQQVAAQQQSVAMNPENVAAREASSTRFEGLDGEQAVRLAGEAFPSLVDEPADGQPQLSEGERIVEYTSDTVARVDLGGGRYGVVESSVPFAVPSASGTYRPIDLGLSAVEGGYQPVASPTGVQIPMRLSDGVSLPDVGVSLTPVDGQGAPLSGSEGVVDGSVVAYANTQTDADTVVKPWALGFEADTILRSASSPRVLSFRVGMPEGASLVSDKSRLVWVVENGTPVAGIMPPEAVDAAGMHVPVSVSVAGDVVTLSVGVRVGEDMFPIEVDPTVVDTKKDPGNWQFATDSNGFCWTYSEQTGIEESGHWSGVLGICGRERIERGQYADLSYTTEGVSKISKFRAETHMVESEGIDGYIALAHSSYEAGPESLPTETGWHELSVASPSAGNSALFEAVCSASVCLNSFQSLMYHAEVSVSQESGPSVSFDTTDPTVEGHPNAMYPGTWTSTKSDNSAAIGLNAYDPGIGIYGYSVRSPSKSGWGFSSSKEAGVDCGGVQCVECYEHECAGGLHGKPLPMVVIAGGELPEGEDTIEATVENGVGLAATATGGKIKVDNTPPYGIALHGLPRNEEIGEAPYHLRVEALDARAGVGSIALAVDGREIGQPSGSCSPGPCTATGEWTITGREFGAGEHVLKITATDNAGNVASEEVKFKVHHATSVAVGPGSVNPLSGEFSLSASDVSVTAPGASLSVSRSYQSEHLTAGAEGPLGPQWALSIGGEESLVKLPTGSMVLSGAGGQQTTFTSRGGGRFNAPVGDSSLVLAETTKLVNGAYEFTLTDSSNGDVTTFAVPTGGSKSVWMPALQEGLVASDTTTYAFETAKSVTRPSEVLAPVPAKVSCAPELTKGCRALTFHYATVTTATGESVSQWGEYEGRLSTIDLVAYNPATKAMATTAVAQYAYDQQGRLRAEWNPQISPALKTTYGYDGENHVTAVAPAGQQPWLLHYGASATDTSTGRLLSVARPAAATEAGDGSMPAGEESPKLSTTTPVMGTALSVSSEGKWAHKPLAFEYQWEDCNSEGIKCSPIPGATNQSYTPLFSDYGHTLIAQVTATNATGSKRNSSIKTGLVPLASPVYSSSYGSTGTGAVQFKDPGGTALDQSSGTYWVSDALNNRVEEFSPKGFVEAIGWGVSNGAAELQTCSSVCQAGIAGAGNGQLSNPEGVAVNQSTGNVYVVDGDTANSLIQEYSSTGAWLAKFGGKGSEKGQLKDPHGLAVDSSGNVWVADTENERIEEFSSTGSFMEAFGWGVSNGEAKLQVCTTTCRAGTVGSENGELNNPIGMAVAGGDLYVTDTGNKRVQEFSPAGAYLGKFGETKLSYPWGIATSPVTGNLYVTDLSNSHIYVFTTAGQFVEEFGIFGSENKDFNSPVGIAISASTGDMYIADEYNNRVDIWAPNAPTTEPTQPAPALGSSAVTTIDYNVPLEGTGLPRMTRVGKWGQSDLPEEATAIFPPDEPMGWPATNYKRATIAYFDNLDRMVNVATPTGGISTTEYNGYNDVVRTLSATNRQKALENELTSEETAHLLSTVNTYEEKGEEPGTELLSTLGPEHTVKLPGGRQVQAREHTVYTYNEGAPSEGGPYHLVTKITQGAKITSNGEEPAESIRTTSSSFAGQEKLGWRLHKPTSITADPSGLKSTHTTVYEASTGSIKETVMPAGNPSEKTPHGTETILFTAESNATYPECGVHPEWANLPCQTQPAKQPETTGLPKLPVTKISVYNMWDEPESVTEKTSSERHTHTSYDAAGRVTSVEITALTGTQIPKVTDTYNEKTGLLEKQSATIESKARTIASIYNSLGQLEKYTDADENTSAYEYDIDGRPKIVNDGKGTQTYTYNETTGLLSELVDSSHEGMKFTATYDIEGRLLGETYPNGMTANYTYNAVGAATGLEYKKTTHCTEENGKCKWFTDTVIPSIHGQWMEQTSSLSHEAYTYDAAGRLTQVQDTPTSTGRCTTRVYTYDADTNRTGFTAYGPTSTGACSTTETVESTESHGYDAGDRLTDTGITYSGLGDITTLPATDAGGAALTSTFYADNQLASQTQSEETIGYHLDPAYRTRETVSTGKKAADVTTHYAGPENVPAWTTNTSGETSRNIPGINGQLAAIQNNGEAPVLQLTNLHGDIVATAYMSETATELASKADTSEYGVPATSAPSKYAWLGSIELPTELSSGVIAMGSRSYVPQLGRFLQPDPIPGGSANAYAYTFGDPVNTTDPTGDSSIQELVAGHAKEVGAAALAKEEAEIAARRAAEQAAARAAAEAAAEEAAWEAEVYGHQYYGGEGEEWFEEEEFYEEEGYEYTSYSRQREAEQEASFGPGVRLMVAIATEQTRAEAASASGESREESESAPERECDGSKESLNVFDSSSGLSHREDVRGAQCPRLPRRYYHRGAEQHGHRLSPGGCVVGAVLGATFAEVTTVGLAPEAGAIAGCTIGSVIGGVI
jgi:RHS repeat-associated protein